MISVVVPFYNEEAVVEELITRSVLALQKFEEEYELICIDDGSVDNTLDLLIALRKQNEHIKIISLSRNFGHQASFLAGLNHAKGDKVALMDGDLQDPPEFLEELINKLKDGYDVAYAIRANRKENIAYKLSYWMYYRLLKSISYIDLPLDTGDFCVMKRTVADEVIGSAEQSLFLRGIRSWVGFKQIGIEYDRDSRWKGKSKYTLGKLFSLAYNGIFSFSHFPVKIITTLGFWTILISAFYLGYVVYRKVTGGEVPEGFTTLIFAVSLFSGVQLIALGLIGEYVLRIYNESRSRPIYVIRAVHE